MDESKGKKNRGLIIALSVLVGLIAVLVVAIVVVNVNTNRNAGMNYEEYEQKVASSTTDCVGLKGIYNGSEELAMEAYNRKMAEAGEDDVYKVNLTLCFVQYIRYHGSTSDEVLALLKAIEPNLSTDSDRIDYYNQLSVYYIEEDDWDNAAYYANLRDELMQVEWPDDEDSEESDEDDGYWYDEYDDEYEQEEE
ncbi:hypothetical protein J5868_02095 [Candidatus Saccharibacteria bacterium]|nr:hypothetical protein [Candidatus Saccharibacteria bacterium]